MNAKIIDLKKTLAVIIAALMSVLLVCSYQTKADAVNTAQSYNVYDADTGTFLRSYTLDALSESNNSRSLIGTDERVIDWTKSGVCKIINSSGFGSGFVIDEHTIATAAHCVFSGSRGYSLTDILLFDTSGNVTMSATPVEYHVPQAYSSDRTLDYALITVEEDLSDYACFSLGVTLDSFGDSNQALQVTGFPGDLNNTMTTHTMYTGVGVITSLNDNRLFYTVDTGGGNSGGPVYVTESYCGYTQYTVIAIHTNGLNYEDNYNNKGTRITTNLINFYNHNSNLIWE